MQLGKVNREPLVELARKNQDLLRIQKILVVSRHPKLRKFCKLLSSVSDRIMASETLERSNRRAAIENLDAYLFGVFHSCKLYAYYRE